MRKITLEEALEKLKKNNPNTEYVRGFVNVGAPATFRCKIHGIEWEGIMRNAANGSNSCPLCNPTTVHARPQKLTQEEYERRVKEKVPTIKILSEYKGGTSPITFQCLVCGKISTTQARVPLMGEGCINCRNNKLSQIQTKKTETFVKELEKVHPNIKILEEYRGSHTKIRYLCTECGYEHSATPTNLLTGYGCPRCKSTSKGEEKIEAFLKESGIKYEKQKCFDDCRDQLPLRFDFYLPDYDILVEFQGEQHYRVGYCFGSTKEEAEKGFEILVKHDEIKREYCHRTGHTELEICYTDIKRCEEIILEAIENKKKEVMPE